MCDLPQVLNGAVQLVTGPLDLENTRWSFLLNILNYVSLGLSYAIVAVDVIKMCFGLGSPIS